jgi:uncharacterized protein YecT (DUF1311 family)
MDRRKQKLLMGGAALALVLAAGIGLSVTQEPVEEAKQGFTPPEAEKERMQEVCASPQTYDALKQLLFDEAIRIRNADPVNLDMVATHSVVRMEEPVVRSRDEELGVTVCAGRFVLELPPGAERGFGGERRLVARVEYGAQPAADGSGLVFRMRGAEPIVYKLAAFDLKSQPLPPPPVVAAAPEAPASEAPEPPAEPAPPEPAPPPQRAQPSFDCRLAQSRSEKMVCSSEALAALDRRMSSLYYSALREARPRVRTRLTRTRDQFLAYRERCVSEACVADAYRGRMEEIRDIVED